MPSFILISINKILLDSFSMFIDTIAIIVVGGGEAE
jgi:hypothetical protein